MRLGMYTVLTLGVAFVYFRLGSSWKDVYSRAALLFFVVAFLTFMAIAGCAAPLTLCPCWLQQPPPPLGPWIPESLRLGLAWLPRYFPPMTI